MSKKIPVSENIKRARITSGLSQKDLAKKLGVSDKTISAYETARAFPPAPTLSKIAEITKTSITSILGTKEPKEEIALRLENIEKKIAVNQINGSGIDYNVDAFVGIVLVNKKNQIYLIKEEDKHRISQGRWNLPGGSVDGSESLSDAAIREAKEETGHNVKIKSLIGCYKCKKGKSSWVYVVFKAVPIGEISSATDPGVRKGKWFDKDIFLNLDNSKIVHQDMKLVYIIALDNKGLTTESVKYIDYDAE